jgi:phosphate-selective porin
MNQPLLCFRRRPCRCDGMGASRRSASRWRCCCVARTGTDARADDADGAAHRYAGGPARRRAGARRCSQRRRRCRNLAAANATAVASAAAAVPAPSVTAKPDTQIAWDGGPKLVGKDGWSFKPRGRLQLDVAGVDAPKGIVPPPTSLGVATEFRRAYIGFDGTMPGGFGYRMEADLANSAVELTDIYLTYKASPEITADGWPAQALLWSMEEMTIRPVHQLPGARRLPIQASASSGGSGASATYVGKTLVVQGGVFTDNSRI